MRSVAHKEQVSICKASQEAFDAYRKSVHYEQDLWDTLEIGIDQYLPEFLRELRFHVLAEELWRDGTEPDATPLQSMTWIRLCEGMVRVFADLCDSHDEGGISPCLWRRIIRALERVVGREVHAAWWRREGKTNNGEE